MGRSPGSLAMKLSDLTALDSQLQARAATIAADLAAAGCLRALLGRRSGPRDRGTALCRASVLEYGSEELRERLWSWWTPRVGLGTVRRLVCELTMPHGVHAA